MAQVAGNSEASPKRRPRGKPFPKGTGGNPAGRPRENPELKALCRERTEEAIQRLIFWMQSDNPKASVTATKEILDRAWGKPSQDVKIDAAEGVGFKVEIVRFSEAPA